MMNPAKARRAAAEMHMSMPSKQLGAERPAQLLHTIAIGIDSKMGGNCSISCSPSRSMSHHNLKC